MKTRRLIITTVSALLMQLAFTQAYGSGVKKSKKDYENQVKATFEPILFKYCKEQCKILSVEAQMDVAVPDEVAPGFDDLTTGAAPSSQVEFAPSNVSVKILMDEMVGPVSRSNLLDLLREYSGSFSFPVTFDTKVTKFPQPLTSAIKVNELKERVARDFKAALDKLFQEFCPKQCLLTDFQIDVTPVNPEEAQLGSASEYVQDGETAIRIKNIGGTIIFDRALSGEEQANLFEMAKLNTKYLKNVTLKSKGMLFPQQPNEDGLTGKNAKKNGKDEENSSTTERSENTQKSDAATKQEKFERVEKIERVENGDAVQKQLRQFQNYAMGFAFVIFCLLGLFAYAMFRGKRPSAMDALGMPAPFPSAQTDLNSHSDSMAHPPIGRAGNERSILIAKRYEIDRLMEELTTIFAEQPRVAKDVFTRILTEEGVETTAQYIEIFGDAIVMDMLKDPSLQADLADLTEFYSKNMIELTDAEKAELLKRLHNRTVASKMAVGGNRASNLFDFLMEMDAAQIHDLIQNESLTVKAIVITQCDSLKRTAIYSHLDESLKMKILTELSRIDHLPKNYIYNVANALKRKRTDSPQLNTEALPGSSVLVNLLERTDSPTQTIVIQNLELSNPESARNVKSKLVSVETLKYLRDTQLLEVIMSLKHGELIQFLRGAPEDVRQTVFAKAPRDFVQELEDALGQVHELSREAYQAVERKVINRIKIMANEGSINLVETNERMFADASAKKGTGGNTNGSGFSKAGGW